MKTNPKVVLLAVSCFLGGFLACFLLTQQPQPMPALAAATAVTTLPPVAMLAFPTVSTQTFQIDGGNWHIGPDGARSRTPPAMPQPTSSEEMRRMRPGYYDLIDTQSRPGVDVRDPKWGG